MKMISRFAKTIFCVFSLSLTTAVHAIEIKDYEKKIKTSYGIKNVVDKVSRKNAEDALRDFISASRPGRLIGSAGHQKAMAFIEERLKNAQQSGATFVREEFTFAAEGVKADKGVNLIWEKKGVVKPDEVIILGANYDTLIKDLKSGKILTSGEMPGADNNASGVVALLSMIEIFSQLDLPKTVKIIFFDGQEFDLAGPKAHLEKYIPAIGTQRVVGFIDVKMIGHDSKREDKTAKYNNMKIYTRTQSDKGFEQDKNFAAIIESNGRRLFPMIDFKVAELPATKILDAAAPFWQLGIPAIVVSGDREADFNPRFQTSNDFYETINLMTYNNVFRFLTSAVLAWNYDIVK